MQTRQNWCTFLAGRKKTSHYRQEAYLCAWHGRPVTNAEVMALSDKESQVDVSAAQIMEQLDAGNMVSILSACLALDPLNP
jgi:hypothetical protein